MTSHLDPGTLYALLDGELDAVAERTARIHLWRCERCRALRDECASVRSALAWYGAAPPAPPPEYWPGFWARWESRADGARRTSPARPERRGRPRTIGVLAAAAAVALALIGGWWARRPGPTPDASAPRIVAEAPAVPPIGGADWRGDYELFERARAAVGSMDPLSKGILLAGLADSP